MSFRVIKFGGTSVASADHWRQIANITERHIAAKLKPIIVCSACSQVSNHLETLIALAINGDPTPELDWIIARHNTLARDLGLDANTLLQADFNQLTALTQGIALLKEASPRSQAQVLSLGELMLTKLGAAFLASQNISVQWHDVRTHLISRQSGANNITAHYLSAECDTTYDQAMADDFTQTTASAIITQGFIAADAEGNTVLLGRGGSDITAAYLSAKLAADACEIWTDVPGIYTTNPQQIPQARLLKHLDYDEAQEIASMGAKVLHPSSIPPVKSANIPLHVKYIKDLDYPGSMISDQAESTGLRIKSILTKYRITLITIESMTMWRQSGFLANVFECFKQHHLSIDLISTSESSVTVSLDNNDPVCDQQRIEAVLEDLNAFATAKTISPCASVSLVGRHIRSILHQLGPVFEVFENLQVHLLSQSANDLNLSVIVDEDQVDRIAKKLHTLLIENNPESYVYSKSWLEEFSNQFVSEPDWWASQAKQLIDIANTQSPCYLYDKDTLADAAKQLTQCSNLDAIFFAMKANPNPAVLNTFYQAGIGFECVSIQEVEHILRLFPDINRHRILFTPNFASRKEYEQAFAHGIHVTVDGVYPLEHWPEVFANNPILLRIDPGVGMGHHKYVCTGGNASKFGIPQDKLPTVAKFTQQHQIRVRGLHAHYGSGILTPGVWENTAKLLTSLSHLFPDIDTINLGGGLGIVERPGQQPLDINAFNATLTDIKKAWPKMQFWLEPGRFLVAKAGVLLAKVTQLKSKGDTQFIGIETGMNSLIRPSLYGAYHHIVNLSKLNDPATMIANIVGPICESADTLGFSRFLPDTTEGDIILIANTGAYGHAMGSSYNCRPPAMELLYERKNAEILTEMTIQD